jgi:4-amino-4-deoxy-L-arabinose transferase-like glycosyltransferase
VRTISPYLFLALVCLVLYVPGQRALPVTDRDEARFMQATRQMLESRDWIVVHFQDQLRAKKPAGIYWLQSAAVATLSDPASDRAWPYRIPSLIAAISVVLITFAFAKALFDRRVAFIAALALASSLLLGVEAHLATTDAMLCALTLAAQGCLGLIYTRARRQPSSGSWAWLVFWLALGAAIMIKGPIAPMICALTILTLSIADRDIHWLRQLKPTIGMLILVAMIAPWFVAVSRATNGIFLSRAINEDLFPKLIGGHEGHGAPPGYYAALLAISMWPASFLLWPALWRTMTLRAEPTIRFLLAWAIPSWIVFELIPTKLPHYTLPLHPAFAVLIAVAISRGLSGGTLRRPFAVLWLVFWSLCSLAIGVAFIWTPMHYGSGISATAWTGAFAALTTIASAWWFVARHSDRSLGASVVAGSLAQAILIGALLPGLSALWTSQRIAHEVEPLEATGVISAAGYYEPSLVFLLHGRTQQTDGRGAAVDIGNGSHKIAIVEERELQSFVAALRPNSTAERAVIDGFNYSQGRRVRLHIFQAER